MGQKTIIFSDISQADIDDTNHARVVVNHPDLPFPVELDVTTEEAEKFQNTALRLVNVTVYAPDQPVRHVTIETRTLDRLFDKVDFDKVLEGGRKAEEPSLDASGSTYEQRRRNARQSGAVGGASRTDKVNYASLEHCGQLHKGRIAPEEARLVRGNQERASQNRYAQTGKDINWDDPVERKRYGLDAS
jgi:hypothetical protein